MWRIFLISLGLLGACRQPLDFDTDFGTDPVVDPDSDSDPDPDSDTDPDPDTDPDVGTEPDDGTAGLPEALHPPVIRTSAGVAESASYRMTFGLGGGVPPLQGNTVQINTRSPE